ncbi:hypothetical protein AB6A40_004587 [Gnathostoma spinigerum]|uniref:C2H2-type domain-containing protein n=1 Tax=Gnathostoma spinigerum TaxID=75299 RepID=A0ABD6ELP2_9BILA
MCGAAFTESNYLKEHHRTCQRWPRKVNDGEFFPECRLCTLILSSPVLYYSHIHMFHREKLLVEASTEQIVPALTWKKITPADAEKLRQQNETSWEYQNMLPAAWLDADYENTDLLKGNEKELGIPEAAISEQRHSEEHCFLCEKIFDSASEVKRHMDEHTEKWLSCPACNVNNREFPVASYQDLLDHLVRNHIDRSDADQGKKLICSFCCICYRCEGRDAASVRSTEEEMARHILYTCNGGRTCLICNNGKVVTVDALKKHRLEKHRVIYERFGCSECPKKFVLRSDFCKHLCNIRYKCSCANPKLFTEREFEEHFATHLNDANDFCNLCIRFLATKQNRLSHMNVHRIMTQGDRHITDIEGNVDTSKKEKEEVLPNAAVCHDSVEISGIGEPVGCNSRLNVENDLDRVSPSPSSSVPSVESSMPNLNGMPMPNNFLARVRQEKDVSPLLQLLTSTPDAAADFSNEALLADTDDEVLIIDAKGEADRTTSSDVTSFAWPVQNEESACLPTGFRSDGTNSEQELEAKKHDRSIQHELVTQNHDISIRSTTLVDDEIQILSEVEEHSSGSVKKREPQVPCSYCSAKFLTRASLRAHIDSHRYDAGNTLVEVYGVPLNVDVYLCRLCCLAYESREIYLKHMKTHGPLLNCEMCCVVTFNDEQVMQHKQQHVGCDKIRPNIYVCFYCAVTYLTEMRIYHHLLNVHGCCLVYFCKSCGFANTYGRTVLHHVKHSLCASSTGRPVHSKDFSVTLSSNFHYQPVDPKAYEVSVHQKSLSVVVPSECIHRTYLMQTGDNVFISCPMCSCLVGFTRLSNEMPARIKTLSRFLKSAKDDNDDILRGLITQWESELVIEAVASRPPIVQTVASLFTESGLRSVPVNPTNALLGCNGTAFDPTSVGMRLNGAVPPEVPPVRRSSNSKIRVNMQPQCQPQNELQSTLGVLHINQSSLAAAAFSSSSPTPLIMSQKAPRHSTSLVAMNSTARRKNQDAPCSNTSVLSVNSTAGRTALSSVKSGLDSVPKRLFSTSLTPPTQHSQARRNPCKFTKDYTIRLQDGFLHCIDPKCKEIRMDKESSGHVHNLKHNPMNIFFCFDCGDAFPAERYAVIHQFEMHRKNELPEIRLKCPLCPFDDPFTNLKDFKCHLRDVSHNLFEHAILRYPMREDICDLKFGTDFARTVHQVAHAEANIASRLVIFIPSL